MKTTMSEWIGLTMYKYRKSTCFKCEKDHTYCFCFRLNPWLKNGFPSFTSGDPEVSLHRGLCPAGLGPVSSGTEPAALSVPPQLIVLMWPAVPLGLHTPVSAGSPSGPPTHPAASPELCEKCNKTYLPCQADRKQTGSFQSREVMHESMWMQMLHICVWSNLCVLSMNSISSLCRCWIFSSIIWLWSRSSFSVFT